MFSILLVFWVQKSILLIERTCTIFTFLSKETYNTNVVLILQHLSRVAYTTCSTSVNNVYVILD